jgi:methionine aminopeptidase, type I
MAVIVKSAREIELMREAGVFLAKTHNEIEKILHEGMSTWEVNKKADEIIRSFGCIPSFLNYGGFPASICVSINDEIIHGIPSKKRILKDGDIVSIDAGVIWKGYQSDAARTHAIGEVKPEVKKLLEVTRQSFFEGIKNAKAGNHLNDICSAIENYVKPFGYGIVREYVGHGIGRNLHEDPDVPNYNMKRKGIKLVAGMTFAIEPMINLGTHKVEVLDDDWTVVTKDGLPSAHYENTILITDSEPEILSLI